MTISLLSGTPGTGKSLDAARELRFQVNRGRPVIGNFDINGEAVKHPELYQYWPNWEINPERLVRFSQEYFSKERIGAKEDYLTLILDECQ